MHTTSRYIVIEGGNIDEPALSVGVSVCVCKYISAGKFWNYGWKNFRFPHQRAHCTVYEHTQWPQFVSHLSNASRKVAKVEKQQQQCHSYYWVLTNKAFNKSRNNTLWISNSEDEVQWLIDLLTLSRLLIH